MVVLGFLSQLYDGFLLIFWIIVIAAIYGLICSFFNGK